MDFWISTPFTDEHRLTLARWRVWEVQVPAYDAPSWHLVGYLPDQRCGKVSSALVDVQRSIREATTKTARTYLLDGPPGDDADAAHLWGEWQRLHGVTVLRDVTADVLAGRQPAVVRLLHPPA